MAEEKPYLIETLRISDVAESLGVSSHQLSHVINKEYQMSFFNLINGFRIEEIKRRLTDEKFSGYTILAIALDTGFNSSASFYRIFKNHTGLTPSQYIKRNKILESHPAA